MVVGCGGESPEPPQSNRSSAASEDGSKSSAKSASKAKRAGKAKAASRNQLPGYAGTFKNDPLLTPQRVAAWSPAEFRIKRNEIYARYGRAFQSADLQAHFGRQSWYSVREGYSDTMLTAHDRANASLIQAFEAAPVEWEGQVGTLMFMDAHTLVISDADSLYGHEGEERHYVVRGDRYVITWTGPAKFKPHNKAMSNVELWTWSGDEWTRTPVKLAHG